MTDEDNHAVELAELTADVVSAYVANNPLPVANLPDLIASVHASLSGLSSQIAPAAKELVPAVSPKKSVFPDHIISLEDGRKFKSMKRHLGLLGMTPDEYREKWGLSHDYPMVAPNYAAKRSALAKASGLGRKAEVKAPAERAKKA
ncbi:MucR family transcriptional regulator [Mesorhizobium sp. M0586]|uniref:MucR family transcriptional regulator n=1 Tax=unclassified Mesorhizobium TaxID=325217 RepID=UPI00333D9DD3